MAQTHPTVLLRHTTRDDVHHDWMIARPGRTRLWTARVQPPSSAWLALGCFEAQMLPPHRRAYLRYEGPVSGDRGQVERVDEGHVRILAWDTMWIRLELHLRHCRASVSLRRHHQNLWEVQIQP